MFSPSIRHTRPASHSFIATFISASLITLATRITLTRLFLVPVFVVLAILYSATIESGLPREFVRYVAIGVYIIAAASDFLDGYFARRLDQRSRLGAFLDPIADKALLLSGIVTLTFFPWGEGAWHLPLWFAAIVFLRDNIVLWGVFTLYHLRKHHRAGTMAEVVPIRPLLSSKLCTVAQLVALGWVMLKPLPLSPVYPAAIASAFCLWTAIAYIRMGIQLLPSNDPSLKRD